MLIDLAALESAVDKTIAEVGALVISWDNEKPVEYGGPDPHGSSLVYVIGRGQGGMTVLCPPNRVAPANTTLTHPSDPRIDVFKGKRPAPFFHGDWCLSLPGLKTTWHKTKREAMAAAVRRLAILDWHARQQGAVLVHEYVEQPDDKYAHLVTASCQCGGWRFSGSARPFVVRGSYDRHTAGDNN